MGKFENIERKKLSNEEVLEIVHNAGDGCSNAIAKTNEIFDERFWITMSINMEIVSRKIRNFNV